MLSFIVPFDAYCYHVGTAIKHLALLYGCTHISTVGIKGLREASVGRNAANTTMCRAAGCITRRVPVG